MRENSIVRSVRALCDINEDDTSFDNQIYPLIEDALLDIHQLGYGDHGFVLQDESQTWDQFNPDKPSVNGTIATIVGLTVRLVFNPPDSGMATESVRNRIAQSTWRLNAEVDPGHK